MYHKNIFSLISLLFIVISAHPQFEVEINESSGAVRAIKNPDDKYGMNWIFSSWEAIPSWQQQSQDWGLGKYTIADEGLTQIQWDASAVKDLQAGKGQVTYKTSCLDIKVDRQPAGRDYLETYTFTNTTGKKVSLRSLDIYTPFNDNYPDAKTCATNRCNAHIWAGMYASYVNAIRMGGEGPHLGLVFTKGALKSYAIENRGKDGGGGYKQSNVRGTILLNIAPFDLNPGESYTVQWKLFWHKGWNDFFEKAKEAGFVRLQADKYVIAKNEKLHVKVDASLQSKVKEKTFTMPGGTLGERSYKLYYDGGKKFTTLNYYVISSAGKLIDKRVHFIVEHQQMNRDDIRNGAYMVYDNELKKIFDTPVGTVSDADRDEGAERLGMGVLIAKWLQTHKDTAIQNSLMRYIKFVREKLQTPDYKVYSNATKTSRHRLYNYPWVAHLYLETYKLTNDEKYLLDYYETLMKYFSEFGYSHYPIGLRIKDGLNELARAGKKEEHNNLLIAFRKLGDTYITNGINYPKSEVNYEQAIVAPAVQVLCELYLVTKDPRYLDGAKKQMPLLEAFNGKQPDVHLYEIALRHWDDYWFGKKPTWGDTMPHYWSTLTADAFKKFYECTGDKTYKVRARRIVENNLLNFKENGEASCAYVYPAAVNGRPGKFYDAFANDQDWALFYYLDTM